jgi:septum site-determining protein MinD
MVSVEIKVTFKKNEIKGDNMKRGKTIGIIAVKGGVGKTTTVSNLGTILARDFGKKVLLVDANFSAPNLGIHLGMVDPDNTLHDVLQDKVHITEAVYEHDLGFHVVPSNLIHKKIDPFKLKNKLQPLKKHYDAIILDSSPNLNAEILATMLAADELLVVTTPDYPTLSCTMHAVRVAKQRKTPITGIILNRVLNKNFELTLDEIEDATGVPVIAVLEDDHRMIESLSKTTPAAIHHPKRNTIVEYKKLAAFLVNENFTDERLSAKFKTMFGGIPRQEINRTLLKQER